MTARSPERTMELDDSALTCRTGPRYGRYIDELGEHTPGFEPRRIVVVPGNDRRFRAGLAHPPEKTERPRVRLRLMDRGCRKHRRTSAADRHARVR